VSQLLTTRGKNCEPAVATLTVLLCFQYQGVMFCSCQKLCRSSVLRLLTKVVDCHAMLLQAVSYDSLYHCICATVSARASRALSTT
jgi:hypothetical protein